METPNRKKDVTQFTMRVNTELWNVIKETAKEHKRSAAKEVEFALEQYVNQKEDRDDNK